MGNDVMVHGVGGRRLLLETLYIAPLLLKRTKRSSPSHIRNDQADPVFSSYSVIRNTSDMGRLQQ